MKTATKREPQYTILSASTILLVVLAGFTIMPRAAASKPNLLGYRSLCAFVPLSTVILLAVAGFTRMFRDTTYKTENRKALEAEHRDPRE